MTQMPDSPAHGGPSTSTSTSTSPRTNTVVVTTGGESTSNSSLLLRLFTSQFFDSWLAVSYLFRYPHIVGVQHYLCNELRKFPLEEVEFFLPQLVHLMITRPNESIAIESLLLDISLQSSHVAILLYWYLQAYLADLKLNPRTATFKHCQRIINQVQELLFTDIAPELIIDSPDAVQHAYLRAMESVISTISLPSRLASLAVRFRSMLRLAPQVRENLQAAIVGIGSTAASAGAPSLAPAMGWIAVAQGQCAKQPERIGEDTDLPPQQNMLSGKNRGPRASPHGRSVSVARGLVGKQIADAVNGADRSREELGPHSTTAIGHQSPFSAGCTEDSHESDSMALESAARVSVSQPATPVTFGAPGVSREDGQGIGTIAASNSLDAEDMRVGSAPERNSAVFNGSGASSDGPPKPAQRAAVGSRSPTPAERTSTDSCRTVAVMESFQRANSVFISGDTAEEERNNKRGFSSRKNYLTKAAKEFQRNAKTLDRRLGRPSDTLKGSLSNGDVTGFRESVGHVAGEDTAATMRETLDDLATYMECERQKLERRTGYFGAEIKFMTTLMDISQRVCAVSKAGRQQFLKAELTLLNHNLDRDTCIPLWCPDADGAHHHHHRIVRIPTDDTVVLNSAERAPYLLTLEVLEPEASLGHPDRARSSSIVGDGLCQPGACAAGVSGTAVGVHQDILSRSADIAAETFGSKAAPPVIITATSNLNERGSPDALQLSTSTSPAAMLSPLQTPATANAAAEEVDEQLMAEVFGDLDDVTSMPNMPMSPVANRRHSGNYASARQHPHSVAQPMYPALSHEHEHGGTFQKSPAVGLAPLAAQPAIPGASSGSGGTINGRSSSRGPISRVPVSQDDIRARMRTASVLLAQLARQQKALGIKMNNLVVPQPAAGGNIGNDSDTARSRGDISDTIKRRGKLSNATIQALAMEGIRDKLIREMMQLEELRLKQPGLDSVAGSAAAQEAGVEGDISLHEVEFKDDPSAKVLKEDWESKKARIRRTSPFGRHKNWNLLSVIVKEGADLRQEQLALQLIREMQRIWQHENTGVFVKYYRIMVTGEGCGLMETITNTVSVHSIKKEFYSSNPEYTGPPYTLYNYFVTSYGTPDTQRFREAQDNFMRSLVPYSLITYILQIRDRHNGNILLDTDGRIIHIDFGFMLSNSPGSVGFEQAPFKFPMEYADILGGRGSAKFGEFRELLVKAFFALRKHADNVCLLVEMMLKDSPLPCLSGGAATVTALRDRFHLALSEQQAEELVDTMLVSSCDNITMRMYDAFQYYSNGIL